MNNKESQAMGSAMTYTLEQVHAFLLGEAPLDGVWFGETPTHGATYSWRYHLRKAIQADKAGARAGGWLPIESAPKDDDEPASDWGKIVSASRQSIWTAMLEAAPHPPVVKESLTVEDSLIVQPDAARDADAAIAVAQLDYTCSRRHGVPWIDWFIDMPPGKYQLFASPQQDVIRDAARYRFLRMSATISWSDWITYECLTADEKDRLAMDANIDHQIAKIDAAMAAGRGEVE